MKKLCYLFFALILFGCSGSKEIGDETIVERSGSKPDWVNTISRDAGDIVFIRGGYSGSSNQSDGEDAAVYSAGNELSQLVGSYISTIGGFDKNGDPRNGLVNILMKNTIITSEPHLFFNNFKPELYSEKIKKTTNFGVEYTYNCYVLVKMAKTDYNKVVETVINEGIKAAQEKNNKEAKEFFNNALMEHLRKIGK